MTRLVVRALPLVLIASLLVAGCASQKPANEPLASPEALAPPAQPAAAGATMAPKAQRLGPDEADTSPTVQMTDWQNQLTETLADLERLDCPNACRALGSLERSVENICGMAGGTSSTCHDVQKKREDARSRVQNRCGVCP